MELLSLLPARFEGAALVRKACKTPLAPGDASPRPRDLASMPPQTVFVHFC